jgi:PAS domain S-box-containing protein/putative nucleotidyltransferase with HDIG domain
LKLEKYYLKIVLDQKATIIELECTLLDIKINADDFIGKNWFDNFIEYTDREEVLKVFNSLFENDNSWKTYANDIYFGKKHLLIDFDNEIAIKDGKKFLYSTGVEHYNNSQVESLFAKKILEQLKSTFEYIDNPVFITNSDNIILFVNKAYRSTPFTEEKILGKSTLEINNLDAYTASLITQDIFTSYYLYIHQTKTEGSLSPYKAFFNYTPLPYQNLDTNGIILDVNKAWTDKFGYEKEDVLGFSFAEFLNEKSKKLLSEKFSEFITNGTTHDAVLDIIHKNKSLIPVRVHGNIEYNTLCEPDQTHCLLEDISDEKKYKQQFQKSYEETIYSFVNISEQKDAYTAGHAQRVAYYSSKIAEDMGRDINTVNMIYKAGMLHDIGKIVIPEAILLKPGSFTDIEFKLMREHPQSGYDILKPISMYDEIADIILYHHEHYDGTGYPYGKKGDEIPFISQLLSVADTFDAMTTNRIYKVRKSVEQAIDELKSLSGTWFEPKLLEYAIAFLETLSEIEQVNQLPETELEKQRFSYFFKDKLTDIYNADYLNILLQENTISKKYECCNFIKLHNMGKYNTQNGWNKGNELLMKVSEKLQEFADREHIYRVYGDDFIILNEEHIDININTINNWDFIKDSCITVDLKHFHLKDIHINSWQTLEMNLE